MDLSLRLGIGSIATLGAGGGVSPVTILGASLLAWWTADRADLITLSGSQVSSWKDVVAGYDVVQAVGGARPLYSATGFNGAPGLTFDGLDDELTLASVPLPTGANPCEMHGILQQDALPADATTRRWFSYGGISNNDARQVNRSVVTGANRASGITGIGASPTFPTGVPEDFSGRHVHRMVLTGSAHWQKVDNGAPGAPLAAVPATGTTRVRIGAATSGLGFWHGKIRDILVTSLLTTEQATALEAWAFPRRML